MISYAIAFLLCVYQRDWCCNFDAAYVKNVVFDASLVSRVVTDMCAAEEDRTARLHHDFYLLLADRPIVNASFDAEAFYAQYRQSVHRAHYCRVRALRLQKVAARLDAVWASEGYVWRAVELVHEAETQFLLLYNECIVNCYVAARAGMLDHAYSVNENCRLRWC